MSELPPYVNNYGKINSLLIKIKEASVPTKFTQDFLNTALGFGSSTDRAIIRLLKRIRFLDESNIPTERYKNFRNSQMSGFVMAESIKEAYADVYKANEYAHTLDKKGLTEAVKSLTGLSDKDKKLGAIVGTFNALKDHANFEISKNDIKKLKDENKEKEENIEISSANVSKIGLSYTIYLNLPATTNIEVFNAIFKSLRENLLKDD